MKAERTARTVWQRFGTRDLRRVALWGLATAAALLLAVFATATDTGRKRLALMAINLHGTAEPRRPPPEDRTRKLAEAVRSLAADRDRLGARLAQLERNVGKMERTVGEIERNVGEITGTIKRRLAAVATPAPPAPAPKPPETIPTAMPLTPVAPPPAEPAHHEFGIDLGGAANIDGLRKLWAAAKTRHGGLLEGLRPIMTVRESKRPGGIQLRLVAGPFGDAAAAARLCSVIAAAGAICQPTLFEGQQLALR